jgi:hypothetical protein
LISGCSSGGSDASGASGPPFAHDRVSYTGRPLASLSSQPGTEYAFARLLPSGRG